MLVYLAPIWPLRSGPTPRQGIRRWQPKRLRVTSARVHERSCSHQQNCACRGRGKYTAPCPKAQRCRCDGRYRPASPPRTAPPSRRRRPSERRSTPRSSYGPGERSWRTRLEAVKKQAERDSANTFAVYADQHVTARDLRPENEQEYRRLVTKSSFPAVGDRPLMAITTAESRDWHAGCSGRSSPALMPLWWPRRWPAWRLPPS